MLLKKNSQIYVLLDKINIPENQIALCTLDVVKKASILDMSEGTGKSQIMHKQKRTSYITALLYKQAHYETLTFARYSAISEPQT